MSHTYWHILPHLELDEIFHEKIKMPLMRNQNLFSKYPFKISVWEIKSLLLNLSSCMVIRGSWGSYSWLSDVISGISSFIVEKLGEISSLFDCIKWDSSSKLSLFSLLILTPSWLAWLWKRYSMEVLAQQCRYSRFKSTRNGHCSLMIFLHPFFWWKF